MLYYAWISDYDRMIWDIAVHIGVRRYNNITADSDISDNYSTWTYANLIAYSWCSFSFSPVFLSYHNAF